MKKLLIIVMISLPVLSCKTSKITTPATGKATSDTALQGDRMKNPLKP